MQGCTASAFRAERRACLLCPIDEHILVTIAWVMKVPIRFYSTGRSLRSSPSGFETSGIRKLFMVDTGAAF